MKASELRIGNLTDKGIVTALPIGCIHSKWNIQCDYYDYDLNEVNPIPLTEEWLLKFGFEKHKNWDMGAKSYSISFEDIYFSYAINNSALSFKEGIISNGWICRPNFKYVHQLQNLYFALTEKELTIK